MFDKGPGITKVQLHETLKTMGKKHLKTKLMKDDGQWIILQKIIVMLFLSLYIIIYHQ